MSPLRTARTDATSRPVPPPRSGRGFQDWLDALTGPDPDLRRQAAASPETLSEGLGEAGADLPAEAVAALVHQVAAEPDPGVRQAICTQLARHDQPLVVDGLVGHLASQDASLRCAVVDVLSRTTTSTMQRVPALLSHPESDVRILLVAVLAALPQDEAVDQLAGLVREDPHPNVVAAAIAELAQRCGAARLPDLRAARERFPDDPFIAFTVDRLTAASAPRGGHLS